MSNDIQNEEKEISQKKIKNSFSTIQATNKSGKNNFRNNSNDILNRRENTIESKLRFKPIFDKIFRNKGKFNHTILCDLDKREKNLEKIISIKNLKVSGVPYQIEEKNISKQNTYKGQNSSNLESKKSKADNMDSFNLETINKNNISRNILKTNSDYLYLKSKKIKSKNNKKNIQFDFEQKYKSYNKNMKDMNRTGNLYNSVNIKNKNLFDFRNDKKHSTKSVTFRESNIENENEIPEKIITNSKSKKIINSNNLFNEVLGRIKIRGNKISSKIKFKTVESPKRSILEIKSDKKETIPSLDLKNSRVKKIGNKNQKQKQKKSLRLLLLDNNDKIIDSNLKNFKSSIKELNSYNNKYNKNSIKNYIKTLDNDSDYTKQEIICIKNEKFNKSVKNFGEINNKIRNLFHNYNIVKNKGCFTERDKEDRYKYIKMMSSLGKNTINNMVTDLGKCQNLIHDLFTNYIDDLSTSYNKKYYKEIDPTLELLFAIENSKYQINKESQAYESKDFLDNKQYAYYKNKELDRLDCLIKKMNDNIGFNISNYQKLYDKITRNKYSFFDHDDQRKKKFNSLQYRKKNIESNIFNLRKLKNKNVSEYNKIVQRFNNFYLKINEEKKMKNLDRILSLINN